MVFLILIIILTAALIILLFTERLRVMLILDTYKTGFLMTLQWFHWFRALITMENSRPVLTLFLFNRKLFKRNFKKTGKGIKRIDLLRKINPEDVHINAYYGFRDPFNTGIACGAVNSVLQFINTTSINQVPDFTAETDYIRLDAKARVNMGTALVNLAKSKI